MLMKRRDFIQLSSFAAAAISFPMLHSCNASDNAMADPSFLSRLFDEKMLREAGKAYIRKMPAENSANKIIKLLSGNDSIAKSSNEIDIHRYLDEKVRDDFKAGRTINVQGWVLSITEARQCALFALANN
jgi:hypothetical protein